MKTNAKRSRHLATLATLSATLVVLTACGQDVSFPGSSSTGPSGVLRVDSGSTSSQLEAEGMRIQMRYQLTAGDLTRAVRTGAARARVCMAGQCVEQAISEGHAEGTCDGISTVAVADARLGIAAAWLGGRAGGVDFCISDLNVPREFEITVRDGQNRSNVIRTVCLPGGFCGSD